MDFLGAQSRGVTDKLEVQRPGRLDDQRLGDHCEFKLKPVYIVSLGTLFYDLHFGPSSASFAYSIVLKGHRWQIYVKKPSRLALASLPH